MNSDLVPYDQHDPDVVVVEGELVDDTCEFAGCDEPGEWVVDPFQAEIYDEDVLVCLCPGHLQGRYDDI